MHHDGSGCCLLGSGCMVGGQLLGCIMMVQAVVCCLTRVYLDAMVQAVWSGVSCLDASWFSCMVGGQFFWFCMKRK